MNAQLSRTLSMELVIFDLETTGFSPRSHEIIQIAAVRMRHGEVIGEESDLTVRPQNGRKDEQVRLPVDGWKNPPKTISTRVKARGAGVPRD